MTITADITIPEDGVRPGRFRFIDPVDIWQADSLSDVHAAIDRVDAWQEKGCYVAGLICYEAAPAFDPPMRTPRSGPLPLCWFAAFRETLRIEPDMDSFSLSSPVIGTSEHEYIEKVLTALQHIRLGNIYQLNYTIRAEANWSGNPYSIYRSLYEAGPVPHAAFLDIGSAQIVSLSPELFLRKRGDTLESRPMKGTAARRPIWEDDEAARSALAHDEKNRAENIMIVDLVRNDLGRVCRIGSIHVPELCTVHRFPTVHQMTSLVRGTLKPHTSLREILTAAFPPGSITGAPKIRAMDIISELEPEPRGAYCGTIGLFFPDGDFECNVAIRTIVLQRDSAVLGLGSGIVADSNPQEEWQETIVKSRFATVRPEKFSFYETLRYDPGEGFQDLKLHLLRLSRSCAYFLRPFPLRSIVQELRNLRKQHGSQSFRVRLELDEEIVHAAASRENLAWPEGGIIVQVSDKRVQSDDFRLYHKTSLREEKTAALEKARAAGAYECLFLNERGELTEGSISNIMLRIDGRWLTPALRCGLLPGVWRERQLASGRAHEAVLTLSDLIRADKAVVGNAVRGEGNIVSFVDNDGSVIVSYEY